MSVKLKDSANISTEVWIDEDDAPEWTDEDFLTADLYHGDKLIRRGRPRSASPKESLTIRLDTDIVAFFKSGGSGWQTRINNALREWVTGKQKL